MSTDVMLALANLHGTRSYAMDGQTGVTYQGWTFKPDQLADFQAAVIAAQPVAAPEVTDALIARMLPAALIFADCEEHIADARRRAKEHLTAALSHPDAQQEKGNAHAVDSAGADALGATQKRSAPMTRDDERSARR